MGSWFLLGIPAGKKHGDAFDAGGMSMPFVTDPDGRSMIKLCADPDTFFKNFPNSFNGTLTGREAIEMARQVPKAAGLLICSAVAWKSFPIYKDDFDRFSSVSE